MKRKLFENPFSYTHFSKHLYHFQKAERRPFMPISPKWHFIILWAALFLTVATRAIGASVDPGVLSFADTLKNPFTLAMTGLPFSPSPYGNGEPTRVREKVAVAIIDSTFRAEGLNLQPTLLKTDSGYVAVTGYDSLHKIGYVWLGGNDLDRDLWVSYKDYAKDIDGKFHKIPHVRAVDDFLKSKQYSIKKIYEAFLQLHRPSANQLAFTQYLKQAIDKGRPDWIDEYKWAYYEYNIQEILTRDEPKDMHPNLRKYLKRILRIKNTKRKRQQLEIALDLLEIYAYAPNYQLADDLIRATKTDSPKENFERISFMYFLAYSYQIGQVYPDRIAFLHKGISGGEDDWKRVSAVAQQWWDKMKVSQSEVLALERAAQCGDYFIAPISFRDERLIYHTTQARVRKAVLDFKKQCNDLQLHCDSLANNIDLQKAEPKAWERCEWYFQNSDKNDIEKQILRIKEINGTTKEEALEYFSEQIGQYILWAKSK